MNTSRLPMSAIPTGLTLLATLLFTGLPSFARDTDVESLRAEVRRQKEQLEQQQKLLDAQARQLERLEKLVVAATEPGKAARQGGSSSPSVSDSPKPTLAKEVVMPAPPAEAVVETADFSGLPEADVADILDEAPIAGYGRGEEFVDEEFLKSVPLFGSNWRFSFGGYAKVDLLYDFAGSRDSSQFLIDGIPVAGNPQPGSYHEFQLRETRFNFEVRDVTPGTPVNKFFTEFDFFDLNSPSSPRLRHAYFQFGNLLVGQTWTTLTELRQLPLLIDFAAGDSLFGGRTVQIRWEQEIDRRFDWAMSLEDYADGAIQNPVGLPGVARSNMPRVVGRLGYNWDHGLVMLGSSVGENRWDGTAGVGDTSVARWNVATGARVYLDKKNQHYLGLGASYGEGSPSDILTFGNAGTPSAVLQPGGSLVNVDAWNAHVALHLQWTDKIQTNFNYAFASLDPVPLLPQDSIRSGGAFHANFLYDFTDQLRGGVEFMFGDRELVNGQDGTAERIQTSLFYYF